MKNDNLDLFFIKLDKKVIVSDKIGNIIENLAIDFSLVVDNNVKFDLFDIISNIRNNNYKFNDEFKISKKMKTMKYAIKLLISIIFWMNY